MSSILFAFCIPALFITSYLMLTSPYYGWLAFLILKPIVEMTWNIEIMPGLSLLHITGIMPIGMYFWLKFRFPSTSRFMPKNFVYASIIAFLFYAAIHLIYALSEGYLIADMEAFARLSNLFAGFCVFPILFNTQNRYKSFLKAVICAAIIPFAILLGQYAGIISLGSQISLGNVRYFGLFHDIVNQRHLFSFALLALIGIVLSDGKFNFYRKILVFAMVVGLLLVFSKAAIMFLFLVIIAIFLIIYKKNSRFILLFILFLVPVFALQGPVYLKHIFKKEAEILNNTRDSRFALQGRVYVWRIFWYKFNRENVGKQLIGSHEAGELDIDGGIHNDFLLNLQRYGYVGLAFYSIMLSTIVAVLIGCQRYVGRSKILDSKIFVSRGSILLWLVDAMGLHPSMYPYTMLFVFGSLGLTLQELSKIRKRRKLQTP